MNKDEKQIIFEIYRACRLCGAGAGYKMPIIQSVIDLDGEDVELQQKIRECVQIEVNNIDRMPPLICELCVDKINDFFEFRRMCHDINKKTRIRLGLPLQTKARNSPDAEDSILGMIEPVYGNSDSDDARPLSGQLNATVKSKPGPKSVKLKKAPDVKIKIENFQQLFKEKAPSPSPEVSEKRETRRKRAPSPKTTRQSKTDTPLSELQGVQVLQKPTQRPPLKSILKKPKPRELEEERKIVESDPNSLLVPRQKRPREVVVIEIPPPTKKGRYPPEPSKSEKSARPGPQSSKVAAKPDPPQKQPKPPPRAGPKSRKLEVPILPPPAKKLELPSPPPKGKKQEPPLPPPKAKSAPAPRSRKTENSPAAALRSRKRESSPAAPRSRKREASSPPKAAKASPPSPKLRECNICGAKILVQGLVSHLKSHTVLFTPNKLACNPCELWFATNDEATAHHRQHAGDGLPYTCSRCYDDFTTMQDYTLHFERNQCLTTYEVPDVKCDDCWHYFATYKLLEDHKCPGEGGRPGGKCSKCSRTFVLMKNLMVHETRCNRTKNEPVVDPEISKRMLPMQVRIAKCDSLLEDGKQTGYDVSRVSHKFGLDRDSNYPYLSIDEDTYVDWDSDFSSVSDDATSVFNPFRKKKGVDTLKNLSLRILSSPRLLGKIPKKRRRKTKFDEGFDSLLDIDSNNDISKNIDEIIVSLGNQSHNIDNYDSNMDTNKKDKDSGISVGNLDSLRTSLTDSLNDSTKEAAKTVDDKESDKTDDSSDITSKTDSLGENNLGKTNSNESANDEENSRLNHQNANELTHTKSEDSKSKPTQDSKALKATDHDANVEEDAVDIRNDNKCTDDFKSGCVVNNTLDNNESSVTGKDISTSEDCTNENESSLIKDVKISTLLTDSEKMDDQQTEQISANNDIALSKSLNDSLPINNNKEVDLSEQDDSQSSDVINNQSTDDSNAERDDSQSSIMTDGKTNHSDTRVDSDSETVDNFFSAKKSNDQITNVSDETVSSLTSFKESLMIGADSLDRSIQSADRLNIDMNDEDRQLMADLDAQIANNKGKGDEVAVIGDSKSHSGVIGDSKSHSEVIGDSKSPSRVISDSKSPSGVIGDSKSPSGVVGDSKSPSGVVGDSKSPSGVIGDSKSPSGVVGDSKSPSGVVGDSKSPSGVIGDSKSHSGVIGGTDSSKVGCLVKNDTVSTLILKQDNDMKSLDLDNISDEEFDFDL